MPNYTNARYYNSYNQSPCGIEVLIDGVQSYVPLDPQNVDFLNITALVAAGSLTIAPAA